MAIKLKRKTNELGAPAHTDLAQGEPAVNTVAGKLYLKDEGNVVVDISSNVIDVTVADSSGNKFFFNGVRPTEIVLVKGQTYTFRQTDSSNSGHPMKIGTATEYAAGTTYGTSDGVTHQTTLAVEYTPKFNVPDTIYLHCQNHTGMGIPIKFAGTGSGGGGGGSTDLTSVSSNITPATANVYDIGSAALPFKDLHLKDGADIAFGTTDVTVDTGVLKVGDNTVVQANVNGNVEISGTLKVGGANIATINSAFVGTDVTSREFSYSETTEGTSIPADPFWDDTILLMNGTAEDKSFSQNSFSGHTLTTSNGGKWGEGYSFDGSSHITVEGDFNFGSGDFSIEFWMYATDKMGSSEYQGLFSNNNAAWNSGTAKFVTYDGTLLISANTYEARLQTTATFNENTWYFVQAIKTAGQLTIYVDGAVVATREDTNSYNFGATGSNLTIGTYLTNYKFNGVLDDIRITKAARVNPSLVVKDSDTNLLITGEGTGGKDSTGNHTVTGTADAAITDDEIFGKYWANDGTGDYVSIGASSEWADLGATFTVEAWVKATGSYGCILGQNLWGSVLQLTGDGYLQFYQSAYSGSAGDYLVTGNTNIKDGKWHHIAMVKNSGTLKLYVDGIEDASASSSSTVGWNSANDLTIGLWNGNYHATSVTDLSIAKGVARYTANFSVTTPTPTAAFNVPTLTSTDTHWDKVVLLLQSEAADGNTTFTDSSKNKHTITSAGTVRHETDNYKFGASSIYMNNSRSSYLEIPDGNPFNWGTGDWTIEYWVKRDHSGGDREYLWCWLPSDGTEDLSFRFESDTSAVFHISDTSGHIAAGGGTITIPSHGTTNWHHHAIVRNGANVNIYINGTSVHSGNIGASTTLMDSEVALRIGTQGHWGFDTSYDWGFGGYIEEFRVTNGVARYTANFADSLPTAAFPTGTTTWGTASTTTTSTKTVTIPTGSIYYNDGNVGIGTNAPVAKLDVAGSIHQNSTYSSKTDMKLSLDTSNRKGTTGVIGSDMHYVDATGEVRQVSRVDETPAADVDYTGFTTTTNVTQTSQTGWELGGNTTTTTTTQPGDSQWDNVTMVVQSDTTDGSTTFVNGKNSSYTFTAGGFSSYSTGTAPSHSTTQKKWGASAIRVYQNSQLTVEGHGADDFNFGNGDFTVEMWIRLNTINLSDGHASRQQGLLGWMTSDGSGSVADRQTGWQFGLQHNGNDLTFMWNGSHTGKGISYNWSNSVDTWYHIAATRNSGNVNLYIDGTRVAQKTDMGTTAIEDALGNPKFYINQNHTWYSASGGFWNANQYSGGNDAYYDDIRITKGHARYTAADETANIPTEAYKTGDVSTTTTTFTADGNVYYDDGKVGIGTTAPAHTLDVRGTSNHTQLFQNGEAVMTRDDIPNQYWLPYDETFGTGDGTEGDENYDKVSLLLHMNGSDSSTAFDDHSQWNHTVAQAAATPEGGTQPTVKIIDGEPASTTLTAHSLDTGLLHYWKMEDDWTDSKGDKTFSTNGTLSFSGSTKSSGTKAGNFAGAGHVNVSDSGLPTGTDARTVSMWIRPESSQNAWSCPFSYGTSSTNQAFSLVFTNQTGKLHFGGYYNNSGDSTATITTDGSTWTHVVATYSGSTATFYFNGSKDGDITWTNNTVLGGNLHIGKSTWNNTYGEAYKGLIDEVGIWNKVLTQTEITALYNSGAGKKYDTETTNGTVNEFGTVVNVTSNLPKYGNAMGDFRTTNAYLSVADHSSFDLNVNDFTAEAWLKPVDVTQTTTSANTLNTGLLHYWRFENNWTDSKGSATFSTSGSTAPSHVSGGKGAGSYAVNFQQSGSIYVNSLSDLPSGSSTRSISAWIKLNGQGANDGGAIVGWGNSGDGNNFCLFLASSGSNSTLRVVGKNADYNPATGTNLNDSNWHHVAITYDGTNTTVYVDGSQDWTTSGYTVSDTGTNYLYIGQSIWGTNEFNGHMDDIGIWNKALTQAEITELYASGNGKEYDDTNGWTTSTTAAGGGGIFQLGKDSLKLDVHGSKVRVQNNTTALVTGTTNLTSNAWNHVAVSRNNGVLRAYLNGTQEGSNATSAHDFNSNNLLNVGKVTNVTTYNNPATGDPEWDNVQILIQGNDTHSNGDSVGTTYGAVTSVTATSIDYSTTVTDPYSATTHPTIYVDTSEKIEVPTNSTIWDNLGTTWTFETWFYRTANSSSGHNCIFEFGKYSNANYGGSQDGFSCFVSPGSSGNYGVHTNSQTSSSFWSSESSMTSLNEWHHIAMCRNGTTLSIYGDGVRLGQVTDCSSEWKRTGSGFWIGLSTHYTGHTFQGYFADFRVTKGVERYTGTTYDEPTALFGQTYTAASSGTTDTDSLWNGYMDDFRITKGVGRYSANFTAPGQEFHNQKPVVIGDQHYNSVSLSAHMNGADNGTTFTDSSKTGHTITAVGDVKTRRFAAGVTGSTTTTTDPNKDDNWDNVELLIQSNTTDGSTTFTDSSSKRHSISPFNQVHHETDQKKFGTTSIHFDGTADKLEVPIGSSSALGSGDWTIEMWFYRDAVSGGSGYSYLMDYRNDDGSGNHVMPALYLNNNGVIDCFVNGSAIVQSSAVSLDTWYHLAVVKSSGTTKMYLNGTQTGSDYSDSNNYVATDLITIGEYGPYDGYCLNGYMEDIRITKGHARYTGNFTVPSAAFANPNSLTETVTDSDWSKVSLLIQSDDQDTSNAFTDSGYSSSSITVSQSGGALHSTDTSKFGTSSIKFDGSDDYLTVTGTSDLLTFGTGDFTIEAWINTPHYDASTGRTILSFINSSNRFDFRLSGKGRPQVYSSFGSWGSSQHSIGNTDATGMIDAADDAWHHVAVSRNGNTMRLYVDGRLDHSLGCSGLDISANPSTIRVGRLANDTWYFSGYMEELRVTKGLGRYTADFTSTLPAGPYGQTYLQGKLDPADSAWDSVKLLVKSDTTDGSTTFTDSSSSHTVTAEGGTTHETEYKKWGTSSIYFDGTNNTLTIADHEDFDLTSGSWTWEGWVYVNSTGANENLVSKSAASTGYEIVIHNGYFGMYIGNGSAWTTLGTNAGNKSFSTSTWHHWAATYDGTTYRLFIDGTMSHSTTSGTIAATTNDIDIGSNRGSGGWLDAYQDDIRFTKGVARYTANFTAPTAAFPVSKNYTWDTTTTTDAVAGYTPKFGISSAVFDGTGDKLTVPASTEFNFDSDYTIEGWVKTQQTGGTTTTTSTLDTGLVSYFKFEDDWNDAKGVHNGTVVGSPSFTTGTKAGGSKAGNFSEGNGITLGNPSTIKFTTASVFCWVKWTGGQTIISDYKDSRSYLMNMNTDGTLRMIVSDGSASSPGRVIFSGTTTINDGNWHHVGFTHNGSTAKIYINGSEDATASHTQGLNPDCTDPTYIGYSTVNEGDWQGQIDEVGFWNRALTSAEITALYNSGNGKAYDDTNGFATVGPLIHKPIITTGVSSLEIGASGVLVGSETVPVATPTLTAHSLDTSLVALWKLDDNWNDSKGSHNLTASGATFSTSKKLGTHAGVFDGSNDYAIDGSASSDFAFGTGDFAIAFWQWSSTDGTQEWDMVASTSSNGGSNGGGWFVSNSDRSSSTDFYLYNGVANNNVIAASESELGITLNDSAWHHYVIERTSGTVKLYVNGALKKTNSSYTTSISAGSPLRLGGTGDGNYNFAGRLDQVAIWKGKGMTADEVTALYNSGNGKAYDTAQTNSVTNGFGTVTTPNVITKKLITGTTAINDNSWNHIAISRNSGVTRIFAKGTLQSATRTSSETLTSTGIIIGSDSTDVYYNGSMDDIRITKGVGRYTANFTPPIVQNGDVLQVGDTTVAQDDIYYTGGKVGFGNTNPDYQVDVTGSVNASGDYFENGVAVETLKRTDAGEGNAKYTGNIEVTGDLKVTSWTIKEEGGNLILVKSDGTKYNFNLTEI